MAANTMGATANSNPLRKTVRSVINAIDGQSIIIACTTIGGDLLGSIFGFYYIKVFLTVYYLNNTWLNLVQILFAVWNAVNDPLFGCMQDVGCACCPRWLMNRRKVILYMGPVYAASSMIFWIPWSTTGHPEWLVGVHLLVALFIFDSMVSLVLSAHCGLFTEYTDRHKGRVKVVVYLEMASLIAGFVILPVNAISGSLTDFKAFQICTAVVAVVAAGFFLITGLFATDKVAQVCQMNVVYPENEQQQNRVEKPQSALDSVKQSAKASKGIMANLDFWCVVLGNFFHIMRTTGDANFLAIFTEALISPNGILPVSSIELSLFYTGCTVLPKLFLVICWPLLQRFGAFTLLMLTLILTAVNCIVTVVIGRFVYGWLALFFLFENILAKGLWPAVYNIFFPDVIEEDMAAHKRKSPLSTMVFTLNALFTKPAISLAPIIIVAVLNQSGYSDYLKYQKNSATCNGTSEFSWNGTQCVQKDSSFLWHANSTETGSPIGVAHGFHAVLSTMFYVGCLFPLACAVVEALCFIPYRLKFRHKRDLENEIKAYVETGTGYGTTAS